MKENRIKIVGCERSQKEIKNKRNNHQNKIKKSMRKRIANDLL